MTLFWSERFFRLERPKAPWGDYGHILTHGMCARRTDDTEPLELMRTGPFLPPLTLPFRAVVVTSELRARLLRSDLTGFSFGPVRASRVTFVPWREWDQATDYPTPLPAGGEPENYVLAGPHRADLAEAMGKLFELRVDRVAEVDREDGIRIVESTWDGGDFFGAEGTHWTLVSARAREWLETNVEDCVTFAGVRAL